MDQSSFWEANTSSGSRYISTIHETQMFIAVSTTTCYLSVPWARSFQSTLSQSISLKYILILPSHLSQGFPSCLFPLGIFTKLPCATPRTCHMRQMKQYDILFTHTNIMPHDGFLRTVNTTKQKTEESRGDHWSVSPERINKCPKPMLARWWWWWWWWWWQWLIFRRI
jgi:hypothetical protein